MKTSFFFLFGVLLAGCTGQSGQQDTAAGYTEMLRETAVASDAFWVRVHAIEFLLALGEEREAGRLIALCEDYADQTEKRIGYWRMKYQVVPAEEKDSWLQKIVGAYLDLDGDDRVHAAETLAKLSFSLQQFDPGITGSDLAAGGSLSAFVNWGMAVPADSLQRPDFERIVKDTEDTSALRRRVASYALGFLGALPTPYRIRLRKRAADEPDGSEALPYLLYAAYIQEVSEGEGAAHGVIRRRLYEMARTGGKAGRIQLARALAIKPDDGADVLLTALIELHNPLSENTEVARGMIDPADQDVRIAAAYALERNRRGIFNQNSKHQ